MADDDTHADRPEHAHTPAITATTSTVTFTTSDGVELNGDLAVAEHAVASAIVCHPHPQYGGNRFNNVVSALFDALPEAGVTAFRFDFRSAFGGGIDERLDALAALGVVERAHPDLPVVAVGYSFGAMVALSLDDPRLAGRALVAPPLGTMEVEPTASVPMLVLAPAHDQFAPPTVAEPIVAAWPDATFETIDSVDHFIVGRTALVADRVATWIGHIVSAR